MWVPGLSLVDCGWRVLKVGNLDREKMTGWESNRYLDTVGIGLGSEIWAGEKDLGKQLKLRDWLRYPGGEFRL